MYHWHSIVNRISFSIGYKTPTVRPHHIHTSPFETLLHPLQLPDTEPIKQRVESTAGVERMERTHTLALLRLFLTTGITRLPSVHLVN